MQEKDFCALLSLLSSNLAVKSNAAQKKNHHCQSQKMHRKPACYFFASVYTQIDGNGETVCIVAMLHQCRVTMCATLLGKLHLGTFLWNSSSETRNFVGGPASETCFRNLLFGASLQPLFPRLCLEACSARESCLGTLLLRNQLADLVWKSVVGNLVRIKLLHRTYLGTFFRGLACEPVLANLFLGTLLEGRWGTCLSEPCLGTCSSQPFLGICSWVVTWL